ncbi:MAG TPA: efflux RND transporter periplasmic adaptor subunit [Candidatus Eisenbacteria bacterium]|jgi:GAF domain-containing protein/multidrug resistance efflux pump
MSDPSGPGRRATRSAAAPDIFATVATRALELEDIALALSSSEEIEPMAHAFLPIVAGAVRAGEACLFLSEGEDSFRPVGHHGYASDLIEAVEESLVEQAACGVAGDRDDPITRDALLVDPAYTAWCEEQEIAGEEARPRFELYAPLRAQDRTVAVLAVGRRLDGSDFGDEDIAFIDHVASSTSLAVRRCILARENADQLRLLRGLARFGREITSTLDLNRVLQTVVNTTEAVIARDRAIIALLEAGTLKIRAVSEKVAVEANEAEVLGLTEVLSALLHLKREIRVAADALEAGEETPRREVFARHFEAGEMQSLLALPLQDEEGLMGFLLLESRNPDGFADRSDAEFLGILSGMVSVAIRNADLYRRVPMVGFLGPIALSRRRWAALSRGRRTLLATAAAAAFILLVLIPWPRHVAGPALVRPSEVLSVTLSSPGVVRQVYVRGGEPVSEGALVATVRNRDADALLASAEANYAIAERKAAEAASRRDAAETKRWSLAARDAAAGLEYARATERDLRLTARVSGVVVTPRVEERVGEHLDQGDALCEIARLDPVHVEVRLAEGDVGSIREGRRARIKVLAYPDRLFEGRVIRVAPQGEAEPGKSASFVVSVECRNEHLALLSGMTGRAKLDAGSSPWAWNALRPLVRALRLHFWF